MWPRCAGKGSIGIRLIGPCQIWSVPMSPAPPQPMQCQLWPHCGGVCGALKQPLSPRGLNGANYGYTASPGNIDGMEVPPNMANAPRLTWIPSDMMKSDWPPNTHHEGGEALSPFATPDMAELRKGTPSWHEEQRMAPVTDNGQASTSALRSPLAGQNNVTDNNFV